MGQFHGLNQRISIKKREESGFFGLRLRLGRYWLAPCGKPDTFVLKSPTSFLFLRLEKYAGMLRMFLAKNLGALELQAQVACFVSNRSCNLNGFF
jgi:hypothetical protein